jgi:HSP20 family protein
LLAAEVRESADAVSVRLEVPGMEPERIDISIIDDILQVSGEKQAEREQTRGNYHLTERAYGRFERRFRLPAPVDSGRADASYRRGVLTLRLPKRSRNRQIKVMPG